MENQLTSLEQMIGVWIATALDSPERLEFFVLSKAEEIKSGDQQRDYFWALQIRHDQLVALVDVLRALAAHLHRYVKMDPTSVINDATFQGLTEYGIEKQIYLEAENIHKHREKIVE